MATNFDENAIVMSGGIKPSTKNTPTDVRTRIESISEVELIPLPFVGMIFFVKDEEQFYVVKSLKGKKIGPIETPDSLVDEFEPLFMGLASEQFVQEAINNVELIQGPEGPMGPEGPVGPKGEDGYTPVIGVDYFTEEEIEAIKYNDSELREMINAIEVPSVEGLASEEFVQQQIEAIEFPEGYDDSELREMINNEVRAREAFVEEKVAELINGAPDAMNTLHELSEAIKAHEDIYEAFVQVNNEALANEAAERKEEDEIVKARLEALEMIDHEEFLKEHQDISHLAVKEEVDAEFKEVEERVQVLETINLEAKPYIDKNGMLVLCGCPAVARGVGEEVHVVVRFFNDAEDKFVFSKEEFAKLRICMGYGAEGVGTKRNIVETTLEMYDIDKVYVIDGGSQITGEIGTVNVKAERVNYIHAIQGARAMNGGERNIIHNFNVNVKDVELLNILFCGGNGYSVTWNSNVVINNTSINALHGGGSNGYANSTVIEMNNGVVDTFYGVNRGIVNKYKFILNEGQVKNFWAGCDEGNPVVNAVELELNGGQIDKFQLGVSGEGDLNPEIVSGHIMNCVVVDGDVSMLEAIAQEKEIEKRMFMVNESGVEIELPEEAKDFDEIHVFVKHKAGEIKVKNDACKWQADMPELVEGRIYELIFTKVANVWLAGCIEYK